MSQLANGDGRIK